METAYKVWSPLAVGVRAGSGPVFARPTERPRDGVQDLLGGIGLAQVGGDMRGTVQDQSGGRLE